MRNLDFRWAFGLLFGLLVNAFAISFNPRACPINYYALDPKECCFENCGDFAHGPIRNYFFEGMWPNAEPFPPQALLDWCRGKFGENAGAVRGHVEYEDPARQIYRQGFYCVIPKLPLENCHNGKDDNNDGRTDCDDYACRSVSDCKPDTAIGRCGNGGPTGPRPLTQLEKQYSSGNAACQCSKDPKDPCEPTDGEPVEVNKGRQTDAREDLTIPGRVPVTIAPFYRSSSDYIGVHGYGFSSLLTTRLIKWDDNTWSLRDERGDREDFDSNGKNLYRKITVPDLVLTTDSVFWEPEAGKIYAFTRKDGILTSLRKTQGGGIKFTYADSAGAPYRLPVKGISYSAWPPKFRGVIAMDYRVSKITSLDDPSHSIDLTYDTAGLLIQATDFTGRKAIYSYDLAGNQTRVTFPDGTLRRFYYQDTARFHRLTAFDANAIRSTFANDTTVLTRNIFDGKDRVAGQSYQGSYYDFERSPWSDTTFHTPVGTTHTNGALRVTRYLRSTTVSQSIPDGSGGNTLRKTLYHDVIENGADQDTGTGELLEPIRWLSRTVTETEIVQGDTIKRIIKYDKYNNIIERREPTGIVVGMMRDSLSRLVELSEVPVLGRGMARYHRYYYSGNSDLVWNQVDRTDMDSVFTERTFDVSGNILTESIWRTGSTKTTTTKTWDASGRMLSQTDPFGKSTGYVYLSTSATQPDSIQYPDGTGERYTRDVLGRVTQTRNHLGQVKWTKYDVLGRDTVSCGYDSVCVRKTYNGPDLVQLEEGLKATATGGYATALRINKYDVDGYGRRVKEWLKSGSRWVLKRKMRLDALGNELEVWDNPDSSNTDSTKWRLVERKRFNGRNHLVERRQFPNGIGADSLVTTYKPDAKGNALIETDPRMAVAKRVFDPWGNIVSDTDAVGRVTRRTYDHRNLVLTEIDAAGNQTSHEYDALGNETRRIGWHADTTLRIYDKGRLSKERSPEGNWTTYQYDSRGRLTRLTQKVGDTAMAPDSNDVFTDYAYDALGRRAKESLRGIALHRYGYDAGGRMTVDTNASGSRSNYYYDALGRVTSANTPAGYGISTVYDNQGRVKIRRVGTDTLSVIRYDDADRPVWERTPGQGVITKTYDNTDFMTKTIDSIGTTTTFLQDRMGRDSLVSVAGKTGRKTVRDAVGRVVEQWDERGYKVSLGYDVLDRLTSLKDNENNLTSFGYLDSAGGWRKTTTYPDAKVEHHIYDREGRLRRFVDGRGIQNVYRYDSLSRLTGIDFLKTDGTSASNSVALSYDRLGRMSKAVQGSITDSTVYDNYGRVTASRQTVNGVTYALSYGYNEYGRIVGITLPDGTYLRKKYTPRGLTDSVWFNPRLLASYSYQNGLETGRKLTNGITASQSYDAAGRLTSLVYSLTGQTLPNLGFRYDASGNRSLIRKNHSTSTSEAMTYTADNQLESWKKGTPDASGVIASPYSTQSWALDSRGNWSTFTNNGTPQTRTHTAANELTAMGASTLAWDAAGNMTSDGSRTYIWGARGLLDTVKQGTSVKGAYTYDPLGRRVMKTVGSIKTISIYDGWQCLYQKVTGSGTDTTKIYAYGNYIDEPVAMIRKWGTSTDTVWYLQGNNYNVEALTDRTGSVVERYAYTPYGAITFVNSPGADGKMYTADDIIGGSASARGNSFFFQGRELDAETGNFYFRNRNYSTGMGRFVSRDPIRYDEGKYNLFGAEGNDPVAKLDPKGEDHKTGRWIDCGDGCRIRVDGNHHNSGRHLHWECGRGRNEGACGENGEKSHGQDWNSLPTNVKECAKRNGFNPEPVFTKKFELKRECNGQCKRNPSDEELSTWIKGGLIAAGVTVIIIDIVTIPSGEGACGALLIRYALR